MAKEWSKAFYKSSKWIKCRASYIAERNLIDGGMCEECHSNLGYIVHHKILLTPKNISDPDITLNHDHLEYVCKECHDRFDNHFIQEAEATCIFDEEGNPISIREIDKK